MATTLTEFAAQFFAGQARTSSAGAAVDDVTGEDLRLVSSLFAGGVVMSPTDAFQVRQRGAGANMSVDVGSGDADADYAVVEGTALGQGNYVVRKESATINVTVPAAHVSSPRIDEVYLVVYDNAYDASSRVLPRFAYRDGTPAGSPSAPGPDAAWDAYLLLATISVPAGDTAITDAQITDERIEASTKTRDISPSVAFGGAQETASDATVTTTFENGASDTFTKPATWNTYELMAWGDVAFNNAASGTGNTGSVRISIDGNLAGERQLGGGDDGGISNLETWSIGCRHEVSGLTGDAIVVIQYRETGGSVTKLSSSVSFIARRLT